MKNRLRDHLTFASRLRYGLWRLTGLPERLRVRSTSGDRLLIRPAPSTDLDTAYEVFVEECYRSATPLRTEEFRLVVDLGANVGYSLIYWLRRMPNARVIAFEPGKVQVAQIREHLQINGTAGRVELHPAGAGVKDGFAHLTGAENQAALDYTEQGSGDRVPVEDWIQAIKGRTVDLLKMDIEGSEYDILADERLRTQSVRVVVLEWHNKPGYPDGKAWCIERLDGLGYKTHSTFDHGSHGIIWGFHRELAHGFVTGDLS